MQNSVQSHLPANEKPEAYLDGGMHPAVLQKLAGRFLLRLENFSLRNNRLNPPQLERLSGLGRIAPSYLCSA